jgi:AcrR family transcriptional regulator
MPPKEKFFKRHVLQAAIKVVEKHGLRSLTARRVATRLKSSTAPVYMHFASMSDLARAVMREAQAMLLDYTRRPYTDRVFLNMGTGIAMFAAEHRYLYRALLLEGNNYSEFVHEILETLEREMQNDPRFVSLSDGERRRLLIKMWTFTHGLASMICAGLIENCTQDFIVTQLTEMGRDVIGATLARHEAQSNRQ